MTYTLNWVLCAKIFYWPASDLSDENSASENIVRYDQWMLWSAYEVVQTDPSLLSLY